MAEPTSSICGRVSPLRMAACILVVGVFLTLTGVYASTLHVGGGSMIRQPLQTARRAFASATQYCDDDPTGRRVLEADVARKEGMWKHTKRLSAPEQKDLSTTSVGARLTWDLPLAAGEYQVLLLVGPCSQSSEVKVAFDDQVVPVSWRAGGFQRRLSIEREIRLEHAASHVSLEVTRIGQRIVTVGGIVLTPAASIRESDRQNLLRCLFSIGAVVVLFATSLCWGAAPLRFARGLDPIARLVLAQGLGFAIFGTAVTVLGIAGWFNRLAVIAFMLVGCVLGCLNAISMLTAWIKQTALIRRPLFSLAAILLIAVLGLTATAALAPAIGVDPLIYHLPIAKWLVAEGRFTAHSFNLRAGFPHFVSNLYAVGLLIFPDPGFRPATLTHAGLGFLWLAAVYATGKVLWGRRSGLAAAFLCASFEGVLYCCTLALSDLGFAAMMGCAVLALMMAIQGWEAPTRRGLLVLAAVLTGAAAVCKVNGPTAAMTLAITAAAVALVRSGPGVALRTFVMIGAISFVVASPMYLKNYLVYHNPLYPFYCGISGDGLEGVNTWAMMADGSWREYQDRVGVWAWIRWPYDWMGRRGVDGFVPGSAFVAGLLLFGISGREWARRNWPLLLLAVCQIVFWLLVSPMARFAWPWLGVLTLLACSPLSERPVHKCRVIMPIVAMLVGLVSMVNRLDEQIRMLPAVCGLSSERAFLASMENLHAGPERGPPLEGIGKLNRRFDEGTLKGRVLIDTNMVAYADFPTVAGYDYLVVASLQKKCWWKLNGSPFLSMGGKSVGDDDLMNELRRLSIGSILVRRGTPRAELADDGKFHAETEAVYEVADQFNVFIDRWVREGRAIREEFADSTLYTLSDSFKR